MQTREFFEYYERKNNVYKCVAQDGPSRPELGLNQPLRTSKSATAEQNTSFTVPVIDTLNFLTYIVLEKTVNAAAVFEAILNYLSCQEFQNHEAFPSNHTVIGYHFEESRCGLYQIQLLEHKDDLVMACTRLHGDATAVSAFWKNTQAAMEKEGLYIDPLGPMDDDDLSFSSDEEDDFMGFEDIDFRFLDFSRDSQYILKLIRDISDPNFNEHSLLLLAWNSQNDRNLQQMAEYSQNIVDGIMKCLRKHQEELPVARCSALLLSNLVQANAEFCLTWEQFELILETLACWALGEHSKRSELAKVSTSQEISYFLSVILPHLGSMMSGTPPASCADTYERLEHVVDETMYEEVASNVGSFLATVSVC